METTHINIRNQTPFSALLCQESTHDPFFQLPPAHVWLPTAKADRRNRLDAIFGSWPFKGGAYETVPSGKVESCGLEF